MSALPSAVDSSTALTLLASASPPVLQGSRLKIVENAGHALPSQIRDEYNAWIRENVEREE